MIKNRSQAGATLALIVACTIIIILIGIGIFFLMTIVGGQRELQHASDSGDLNVAKQAILRPNIELDGDAAKNFGAMSANRPLLLDKVDGKNVCNLNSYNRLVGQALLVAMNAEAQGTPEGYEHAGKLFTILQGPNGVGSRLAESLGAQTNTTNFFQSLHLSNTTRMINGNNARDDVHYAVGFLEQRPTDVGATNCLVPIPAQIPPGYAGPNVLAFSTHDSTVKDPTRIYIRGYRGIKFPNIPGELAGVPVQPQLQPHLVSAADFNIQQTQPVAGAILPPNSFQSGVSQKNTMAYATMEGLSRALVGVLDSDQLPGIPGGYIVVHNDAGRSHSGDLSGTDTVLNHELEYPGIELSGNGFFSKTSGLVPAWQDHNKESDHKAGETTPTITDLWDKNGDAVTSKAQAHQISGGYSECHDENTYYGPGGNSKCADALKAMDNAYHPAGSISNGNTPEGHNLTALESTKCDVMHQFNGCGDLSPTPGNGTSGQQVYKQAPGGGGNCLTASCPWEKNVFGNPTRCSISDPGSLRELMRQSGKQKAVDDITTFLRQRLAQMNPDRASVKNKFGKFPLLEADLNSALAQVCPLGADTYIYYSYDNNGTGSLKSTQSTPPGFVAGEKADGSAVKYFREYKMAMGKGKGKSVNPKFENGIHDQLYKCPTGSVMVTENAVLQPSSGFNNLLGEVDLNEVVTYPKTPHFCCPD